MAQPLHTHLYTCARPPPLSPLEIKYQRCLWAEVYMQPTMCFCTHITLYNNTLRINNIAIEKSFMCAAVCVRVYFIECERIILPIKADSKILLLANGQAGSFE